MSNLNEESANESTTTRRSHPNNFQPLVKSYKVSTGNSNNTYTNPKVNNSITSPPDSASSLSSSNFSASDWGGTANNKAAASAATPPSQGVTVVISNSSSCTLQLQSSRNGKESQQSNTYTVHFNREKKTKTTKTSNSKNNIYSGSNSSVNNPDSNNDQVIMVNNSSRVGGGAIVLAESKTGKRVGVATSSMTSPISSTSTAAASTAVVSAAVSKELRETSTTSTRPCCFCWCCCCTCSWIRKRCFSVKPPNGSLEAPDFSKDDEFGSMSSAEVKSWGESFEKLMASEKGRKVFRAFLRCEYSEENILFWLACEDLKKERSPELIEEKARIIYEDYVSILSPREVSLDSRVREIINRNMIAPSPHTFDEAQLQIYTLMHRDSYPRFVNSTTYKNLLRTHGVATDLDQQPQAASASGASGNV